MYIIVGLGNPGQQYAGNRHNVGFMCLDELAKTWNWQFGQRRARSLVASGHHNGESILLVKPLTYMNLSGIAVANLIHFHRLPPTHLLVISDDLDLPLGKLRLRERGSAGGHRGLQSIIDNLGTNEFPRLKIGIGRPEREPTESYVLRDFGPDEKPVIMAAVEKTERIVETFLNEGITTAMNKLSQL